jgi:hypothetical protein
MPDVIKDGNSGNTLRIDSKNRLHGYVVIEDEASFINRVEKEMYSGMWDGGLKGGTADNVIIYLKNTSEKDLIIAKIKHRCEDASGTISFWLGMTGTPGGSLTTLTPNNRNAGSNNTADCTYYKSTEITGLSGGRKVGSVYGKVDEEFEFAVPCSSFIVPQNNTFCIKVSNNTTTHYGGIAFYFRDPEDSL